MHLYPHSDDTSQGMSRSRGREGRRSVVITVVGGGMVLPVEQNNCRTTTVIIFRTVPAEDKADKTWQRSWKGRRRRQRRRRWRRGRPAAGEMIPCWAAAVGTSSVPVAGLPRSTGVTQQRAPVSGSLILSWVLAWVGQRSAQFFIVQSDPGSFEAALQRLLASRPVGGYSLSTCDPAPGSLTAYQSVIVSCSTRLDCAASASLLVGLVSNSVRGYLDAYQQSILRPSNDVEEVANLGPTGLCVDPVFQQSRRQCVGGRAR